MYICVCSIVYGMVCVVDPTTHEWSAKWVLDYRHDLREITHISIWDGMYCCMIRQPMVCKIGVINIDYRQIWQESLEYGQIRENLDYKINMTVGLWRVPFNYTHTYVFNFYHIHTYIMYNT